ncbi:hypothetical protein BO82DRAFT_358307 [Aspergillus uvarum CBS 121591]|uniref:Uncharacterized protein n=1 Tax=Aspergillus uvarum CBS 121591 TaxID=1448315 RepID=A0A319BX91_9EURO|nr:hypothetical protein BO82DRAFT_358307 [Aspergillus uvarum CBS 121591]PYH77345.1 hypothetical protein BO82DRAFT_358307 [Aspergillus uvarum CBS 121591]
MTLLLPYLQSELAYAHMQPVCTVPRLVLSLLPGKQQQQQQQQQHRTKSQDPIQEGLMRRPDPRNHYRSQKFELNPFFRQAYHSIPHESFHSKAHQLPSLSALDRPKSRCIRPKEWQN